MNGETLISQADYAIDMFMIDYSGTCCLYVRNGFVTAVPAREAFQKTPSCLFLTHVEQKRGLTGARRELIGTALHKLYTQEKECQKRPKL